MILPFPTRDLQRSSISVKPQIRSLVSKAKSGKLLQTNLGLRLGGGPICQPLLLAYYLAGAVWLVALAYLRRNRSTRPAVSTRRCLPVKNGWQFEQISTWMSPLWVDRVSKLFPQAHITRTAA
jgi:hypothetical protein